MDRYDPLKIEQKWQKIWDETEAFKAGPIDETKPKKYVAEMFPYPSGAGLHVGHVRNFTIVDVLARFYRQQEINVLRPFGYDTFGLPAENYAIKTGISPQEATKTNIANFRKQAKKLGYAIDWSREINTSDPEYYKWTQWCFLQLYQAGLAYQKESYQWWCPVDKTVLANEQVENGHCWRCGHEVEKKKMKQWFFKITDYADELLEGIDALDWPEKIKTMQRNWIGRSEGAEIKFAINNADATTPKPNFVILHGYTEGPESIFIPALKKQLEQAGYVVQVPQLPNTNVPQESEQVDFVLKNVKLDENTIIIAHSLGCAVAMQTLAQLDHGIRQLILIAPGAPEKQFWTDDFQYDKRTSERKQYLDGFSFQYDYPQIVTKFQSALILGTENDAEYRLPWMEHLSKQLGAEYRTVDAEGCHFTGEQEPAVLQEVMKIARKVQDPDGITVFTTRPDTIFGVTFLVLAPEHPLIMQLVNDDTRAKVEEYCTNALRKSEIERQENKEKTGVFTGSYAINPANGEKIPIWVADYVLMGYGTGAIMAVPAHDERDFEFAEKFELPVVEVVERPENSADAEPCYHGEGELVNSEQFNGTRSEDAREQIVAWLEERGVGRPKVTYKMRDWLISRQRYWGCPIPIAYDKDGHPHPIPEDQLPVMHPAVKDYQPDDSGRSPLAKAEDWLKVTLKDEHGHDIECTRETDTLDGYACSSWYLWRYVSPHDDAAAWDPEAIRYWAPTDVYVGGDHAVAHLLYVRFWCKFFADQGYLPFREPIKTLLYNGYINAPDGKKMSKSKGNVIDPLEVIESGYGADTLRTYEMFIGPYDQDAAWNTEAIGGVYRFLNRCWTLAFTDENTANADEGDAHRLMLRHATIKKVTNALHRHSFNTAVAILMEYTNELYKLGAEPADVVVLAKLLKPFAPHLASEILEHFDSDDVWPTWDEQYLVEDQVEVVVQVNGKLRARIQVAATQVDDTEQLQALALADPNVQKFTADKTIRKVIVPKGAQLINLVVG